MDSRGFGERKTLKLHKRKESKALGGGGGMQSPLEGLVSDGKTAPSVS